MNDYRRATAAQSASFLRHRADVLRDQSGEAVIGTHTLAVELASLCDIVAMHLDNGGPPEDNVELLKAERALTRYLVAVALNVCDRWDNNPIDEDAMSNDIATLRRAAQAVHAV